MRCLVGRIRAIESCWNRIRFSDLSRVGRNARASRNNRMTEEETLALVDRISAAFAAHDVDAMASLFAENGAFVNAVGPD